MKHQLPPLPYDYGALEPHVDARTMQLHHDKHHATYVEKLNTALEKYPDLQQRSATWLLTHLDEVPQAARTAVRNNAGGHLNHSVYWRAMAPKGGESFVDQIARARNGLARLPAGDVVLVVHSGTVRAVLAIALDLAPDSALRFVIEPLSLTRIDRLEQGWRVVSVNQR